MRGVIGLVLLLFSFVGWGCAPPPPAVAIDIGSLMAEAQAALAAGRAVDAELLLREVIAEEPAEALAHAELARALHAQGRDHEAVVSGRLAFGMEPALWEAAYNLACHYSLMGDLDAAVRWLQEALILGGLEAADILEDPDLLALHGDHRFIFFTSTGMISRAEEDALVLPSSFSVAQGEELIVTVLVVALNRPLMGERPEVDLALLRSWPEGSIDPIARVEVFATGESGGREYIQRTIDFTFRPLRAGLLPLGPFRVTQGDSVLYTHAPLIEVRSSGGPPEASSADLSIADFFRVPSSVDRAAVLALGDGGNDGQRSVRSFKAVTTESLPEDLLDPAPGTFRSVFLQRGTEGLSHVVDFTPASQSR